MGAWGAIIGRDGVTDLGTKSAIKSMYGSPITRQQYGAPGESSGAQTRLDSSGTNVAGMMSGLENIINGEKTQDEIKRRFGQAVERPPRKSK